MAIDMTIDGQAIRPDDVRALSILNVMPLILQLARHLSHRSGEELKMMPLNALSRYLLPYLLGLYLPL